MMGLSEFKITATWGKMRIGTTDYLTDYMKAESEDEVRQEFNRNIVNRHFERKIISVQKIKELQ